MNPQATAPIPNVNPSNIIEKTKETANVLQQQLLSEGNKVQQKASSFIGEFRENRFVSGGREFLESNTLVAKISFFILILLGFILLLRLGTRILQKIFTPTDSPMLISGTKNATEKIIISQTGRNNIPIFRSNNENKGIEFTYSLWMFIKDLEYRKGKKKHVFHKGSKMPAKKNMYDGIDTSDMAFPNNAPGMYIHEDKNTLVIVMNTFDKIIEEVEIPNIPLNKWFHVTIRVENKYMDVFINGSIAKRHKFNSVPKQNYGDIFINDNQGFSGYMSTMQYHNKGLNGTEISAIVNKGPNMKMKNEMTNFPPYLSLRWFLG